MRQPRNTTATTPPRLTAAILYTHTRVHVGWCGERLPRHKPALGLDVHTPAHSRVLSWHVLSCADRSFVEYARAKPELLLFGGVGEPGSLPPATPTTKQAAIAHPSSTKYTALPPHPGMAPRSSPSVKFGYEFLGLHPLLGVDRSTNASGAGSGGDGGGGGGGVGDGGSGGGGGGGGGTGANASSLASVEAAVDTYRALRAAEEGTLALLDARAAWVAELKAAKLLRCARVHFESTRRSLTTRGRP